MMNKMSDSPEVELLHRAWEAMTQGDIAVLENSLAPQGEHAGDGDNKGGPSDGDGNL
jgi:hypothetical protein